MEDNITIKFEESLVYLIQNYNDGEAELRDIENLCSRLAAYKRNRGLRLDRLNHNPREKAFHDQWLKENNPQAGYNNGHGILQDLFIDKDLSVLSPSIVREEISPRDKMIYSHP